VGFQNTFSLCPLMPHLRPLEPIRTLTLIQRHAWGQHGQNSSPAVLGMQQGERSFPTLRKRRFFWLLYLELQPRHHAASASDRA
jgi:hypothetical protein